MKIAILKEREKGESRVAATPETVKRFQKQGFEVLVETQAGEAASFTDQSYQEAGARIIEDISSLYQQADIILKVRPPLKDEISFFQPGQTLISFLWPAQNKHLIDQLASKQINALAMDAIPRITRAQKMDALSSMANIAGYRAVIEAAHHFGSFFTGQITAAGKISPARVLVIGAGVAGLAAIGAARGLGAIIRAFDTRPAVKDQIKSMGAEFLELNFEEDGTGEGGYAKVMSPEFIKAEMELFAQQAKDVDIIITTALIPGKRAPTLITQDMVLSMKPGSVIVDLAAEQGGNCELTKPGQVCSHQAVTVIGYTDLPSRMAPVASLLYGNNLAHFLDDLGKNDAFGIDLNNEVIRGALVLHQGQWMWPAPRTNEATATTAPQAQPSKKERKITPKKKSSVSWLFLAGIGLIAIGWVGSEDFLSHLIVFVLSCIVGWQVIWNVKPALHTPLMSVTNAISGIIILGGLLQTTSDLSSPTTWLGALAIFVATINIAGGFGVTHRMLKMFQKDKS